MKTFLTILALSLLSQTNVMAQAPVTPSATAMPQMIPAQNADDLRLTARVNQQIRSSTSNFVTENYNVFTQYGQVTIQGRARTQSEADEILSAARSTPGISGVVNGIVIDPKY